MPNHEVKDRLVRTLCEKGKVVSPGASTSDLRLQLNLNCSNNVFSSALSAAIREHLVVRRRPEACGVGDDSERPICLEPTRHALKCYVPKRTQRTRASFAL